MKLEQRINSLTKLLIAIITLICLVLAKSIYLTIIITLIAAIFIEFGLKSVEKFLISLKNYFLILSIFGLIIIIILGVFNINTISIVLYKIFISSIILSVLDSNVEFSDLHSAIFEALHHIKFINYRKISLNITMFLFFIKTFINAKKDIIDIQKFNNKISFKIKYYFFPRLLRTIRKMDDLKLNLKLSFYEVKCQKFNLESKLLLILSLLFLITCIFKEVIL